MRSTAGPGLKVGVRSSSPDAGAQLPPLQKTVKPPLTVRLLGDPEVIDTRRPTAPVHLATQKALAVFCYLTCHRGPVPRGEVASLLWAAGGEEEARHSLRQALFEIRRALGPDLAAKVIANRHSIWLDPLVIRVDVHAYERLLTRVTRARLRVAQAFKRGDFLTGLHTREPRFDAWVSEQRTRLARLEAAAVERLAACAPAAVLFTCGEASVRVTHVVQRNGWMRIVTAGPGAARQTHLLPLREYVRWQVELSRSLLEQGYDLHATDERRSAGPVRGLRVGPERRSP